MSFFFGKKDKKNLQVQSPGPAPSSPSPISPVTPSSPSPPIAALSTSPLTNQSHPAQLLPYSPLSPSSPLTALPTASTSPSSPSAEPTLSIKKTKKKNALLSIFTKKQAVTNKQPDTLSPTLSPASLSPNTLADEKKKKGMFGGMFRRKKKQKQLVKNDRTGEEEEREISVSVTVSRLHRMDDEEDGLQSYEDDILLFPIFGIPLKKIMDIKQGVLNERGVETGGADGSSSGGVNYLPKQMVDLCEYIRAVGLSTEGVFRISGESEAIKDMKERIDRGEELELVPSSGSGGEGLTEAATNIHNLTGLFKLYWRSLGEPLFPFTHYEQLIAAVDAQQLPSVLPPLLTSLPEPNKSIVAYLLSFLSDVTSHFQHNKMTPLNLAVCFAPNLLRAKEEKAERVMVDAPKVVQLLCWMIEDEGRRREEERRREREEEETREQKREEERREREAEVMIATQHAKERRKQQEDSEREEKKREQQQRDQQEAIEREMEEQMEQERQRKERQLAHLREQDAKRKQKQQQDDEEAKRRALAAKKAQQTVLDHLPNNRARSATDGEDGEAPSFFAIPNPQSPPAAAGGRKMNSADSILPPFASSQLPVVILMPSTFSVSAPSSSAASCVSSPSSAVATIAERARSSSSTGSSARFAATTPALPALCSPASGFVVQVVDEDERIVLSQGNQANDAEDQQSQPADSSSTTYYAASSPSSSPPSEVSEPSEPYHSAVHIHVQPLPSDSPPSTASSADTDDDELSSMMRRLSVIELGGTLGGSGSEEERRRGEVARLEESLKGKRAEEEERRREEQIVMLQEAMREKEERKKKNQQRKEEEERDRQRERDEMRASRMLQQRTLPLAGKEEEERKENGPSSQLPELALHEDYFQMLP